MLEGGCLHIFRYLPLILLAVTQVLSTCPPNPLDKVQQCTANVLPELSQSQLAEGPEAYRSHVQAASETCRDSRLRDAADCMQDILDKCRGTTDPEQMLQRLIDKDKLLNTIDYFCRHIRVYERNAECIASVHEETWACSQDAHKSFETKVKTGANMDVLITGSCRFHAVARGCLTNVTQHHCGADASNFVYTILTGQMPPYCETQNPEYRPADTTYRYNTDRRWESDQDSKDGNGSAQMFLTFMHTPFVFVTLILSQFVL